MSRSRAPRSNRVPTRSARRAVNKELIALSVDDIVNVKREAPVKAAAGFPVTITGLRWSLHAIRKAGSAANQSVLRWVIIVLPQGSTSSSISFASNATVYAPEQNVLAFGQFIAGGISGAVNHYQDEGSTKTMRKLRVGDRILVLLEGSVAIESWDVAGTVQWFEKA